VRKIGVAVALSLLLLTLLGCREALDSFGEGVEEGRKDAGGMIPPAATPRAWAEVASWSGNGIKTTPKFTVGDEWAIKWATQPGQFGDMNFQIYLYAGDGSLAGVDANVVGAAEDTSYKHQAGTYHLMVNSGQPWQIKILDNR